MLRISMDEEHLNMNEETIVRKQNQQNVLPLESENKPSPNCCRVTREDDSE